MAAMRKLTISWGMIQANVGMYKATNDRNAIKFNNIHKDCSGPTGLKKICKQCQKDGKPLELTEDDIVSGFMFAKGKYVPLTEEEIENVKVESNGAVIIKEMMSREKFFTSFPAYLYGDVYYLQPDHADRQPPIPYTILHNILKDTIAVGRTAMSRTELTVAVTATNHGLAMYVLRSLDEVRQEPQVPLPAVDPSYLKIAEMIKQQMWVDQPTLNQSDKVQQAYKALIDAKLAGVELPKAEIRTPQVQAADIADMLKMTLDAIKAQNQQPKPAAEPAAPAKKGKKGRAA